MGLAASQARFLAITARKMNCEFQSMQIAQEKLSVTRDLQKASQDYQDSLDQTILVWDAEGTDETYNLSYDTLMVPSAINDFTPNLITDTRGAIVLTPTMYNAAVAAGIIDDTTGRPIGFNAYQMGGANSQVDGSRNAFLYQLGLRSLVQVSDINSIIELGDAGYNKTGAGIPVKERFSGGAITSAVLSAYLSQTVKDSSNKDVPLYSVNILNAFTDVANFVSSTQLTNDGTFTILKNGTALTQNELSKLSLGDLLSTNYSIAYKGAGDMKGICTNILEQLAIPLGYNNSTNTYKGLDIDGTSHLALKQAFEFTKEYFNSPTSVNSSLVMDVVNSANSKNAQVTGENSISAVSLTNMLKVYLTEFARGCDGFDAFVITNDSGSSSYVTNDSGYKFLFNKDAEALTQAECKSDFYNMLYNQICLNGACTDETKRNLVTDKKYLDNAIKNGQLFVSSIHSDGYFYHEPYALNNNIAEVPDEEAIAQAEVEYEITKSKLNYREQSLDIQMKNLDTEISALTTEFDTVKNLISKNVEKIFTMFSS